MKNGTRWGTPCVVIASKCWHLPGCKWIWNKVTDIYITHVWEHRFWRKSKEYFAKASIGFAMNFSLIYRVCFEENTLSMEFKKQHFTTGHNIAYLHDLKRETWEEEDMTTSLLPAEMLEISPNEVTSPTDWPIRLHFCNDNNGCLFECLKSWNVIR